MATCSSSLKSNQHQLTKQSEPQERGGERKKERDQEGRKEEERKVEERGSEQVKKSVTGWTEVTRKKRRKMVQIFVKVDGSKVTPMEVSLSDDKVEDVMKRIQSDVDAYVTMHGRVLKRSEKLRSCGVSDGCTIQVVSRMRGGGKHKNKKSKTEMKGDVDESGKQGDQVGSMSDKCQEMTQAEKDVVIQMIEGNEGYRKLITTISEAENWEYGIQCFGKQLQEESGIEEERAKVMEWGMRWAVEARRRRDEEQGQSTGQDQSKQGKQVRFGDEEQTKKTWIESTDELEMMSELAEVTEARTGRGSTGLVRGEMRGIGRTSPAEKAKGRVMAEKANMEAKEE